MTHIVGRVLFPVQNAMNLYEASVGVDCKKVVGWSVSSFSREEILNLTSSVFIRANLKKNNKKRRKKGKKIEVV